MATLVTKLMNMFLAWRSGAAAESDRGPHLHFGVTLDGDEKEIREYPVEELKFRPRKKKEKGGVSDKELKKLEALEKQERKSKLDDD